MAYEDLTPLRFGNNPTVTLNVGLPATTFCIHRDLICRESAVFNAAFSESGHFLEARNQTMDLVEEDAVVFDRISNWLYTGKLNICVDKAYYTRYGEVYATAEKYGMVNLKNYLIGHLIRRAKYGRTVPPTDVVKYVYSTTPSNSPLRKLFIALYIWYMDKELWASMVSSASLSEVPDFAADLAIALGNKYFHDSLDYTIHFQGKFEDYYEDPRLLERGKIMK